MIFVDLLSGKSKVKNNFGDLVEDALFGYLNSLHIALDGCVAFIILTDQLQENSLEEHLDLSRETSLL